MNADRTRYGDLTRQAALHLSAAAAILTNKQFRGLPAASAAVTAYADLHDAFYRLGWQLRGGTIAQILVPDPARRDGREGATLDLLEQVGRLATRFHSERVPRAGVAGQWNRAAIQLRTAHDLLATHHTPIGTPRTPDTPDLQDLAVAGPAWRDYASLVLAAASVAEPLAIRARAAGVAAPRVRGLPWAGDRLTRAAEQLRAAAAIDPSDPRTEVIDLELAHPTVRTGDQLLELSDRLQRVQTAAWTHTQHATMTVPTLTDLAAVGVMIHASAHRVLLTDPSADPATVDLIAAHGTAWRQVYTSLGELRSIDPVPGGIRADMLTIRRLLPEAENDPRHERVAAVLVDACRCHDRVADWSAAALSSLSAQERVYLPGRALTSDDIGDDSHLVDFKLADTLTLAPIRVMDNIHANLASATTPSDELHRSDHSAAAPAALPAAVL